MNNIEYDGPGNDDAAKERLLAIELMYSDYCNELEHIPNEQMKMCALFSKKWSLTYAAKTLFEGVVFYYWRPRQMDGLACGR